jgi:hypothetical protein
MSNQWLFVSPQMEMFLILCQQEMATLKLQQKGKLSLKSGCKGYSPYVTLYAMSTSITNITGDYVPIACIDFDCCFDNLEDVKFEHTPWNIPLTNVMSSVYDLYSQHENRRYSTSNRGTRTLDINTEVQINVWTVSTLFVFNLNFCIYLGYSINQLFSSI